MTGKRLMTSLERTHSILEIPVAIDFDCTIVPASHLITWS